MSTGTVYERSLCMNLPVVDRSMRVLLRSQALLRVCASGAEGDLLTAAAAATEHGEASDSATTTIRATSSIRHPGRALAHPALFRHILIARFSHLASTIFDDGLVGLHNGFFWKPGSPTSRSNAAMKQSSAGMHHTRDTAPAWRACQNRIGCRDLCGCALGREISSAARPACVSQRCLREDK